MANGEIEHEGVVIGVSDDEVTVSIQNKTACAGCHAKGACGMSSEVEKRINVFTPNGSYKVGDKVFVIASTSNAILSVVFAYIIPSILILGVLAILIYSGTSEVIAAVLSLSVIVIYYFILYMYRNKFSRRIKFKLKKVQV